jgi:hypothetical protein
MLNSKDMMAVEILYRDVDRIGMVPQVNERFPCEEAPTGSLLVMEKTSIVRAGRRIGWVIRGAC